MSTPTIDTHAWADGFGIWHVTVEVSALEPRDIPDEAELRRVALDRMLVEMDARNERGVDWVPDLVLMSYGGRIVGSTRLDGVHPFAVTAEWKEAA